MPELISPSLVDHTYFKWKQPSPAEAAVGAGATPKYDAETHGSVMQFENHPDFPRVKDDFQSGIAFLSDFVLKANGDPRTAQYFSKFFAEAFSCQLEQDKAALYSHGIDTLRELVALAKNEAIPQAVRMMRIEALSRELDGPLSESLRMMDKCVHFLRRDADPSLTYNYVATAENEESRFHELAALCGNALQLKAQFTEPQPSTTLFHLKFKQLIQELPEIYQARVALVAAVYGTQQDLLLALANSLQKKALQKTEYEGENGRTALHLIASAATKNASHPPGMGETVLHFSKARHVPLPKEVRDELGALERMPESERRKEKKEKKDMLSKAHELRYKFLFDRYIGAPLDVNPTNAALARKDHARRLSDTTQAVRRSRRAGRTLAQLPPLPLSKLITEAEMAIGRPTKFNRPYLYRYHKGLYMRVLKARQAMVPAPARVETQPSSQLQARYSNIRQGLGHAGAYPRASRAPRK